MPSEQPQGKAEPGVDLPVAVFEHLTGPSRGTVTWIGEQHLNVTLSPSGFLHVSTGMPLGPEAELVARLQRTDGEYEIEAIEGRPIWVNGRPTKSRKLEHQDMIEFGQTGPMSRVYLCRNGEPLHPGIADILSDAAAYFRSSRRPLTGRLAAVAAQVPWRLSHESTIIFRVGVILALLMLGFVIYQQSRINLLLRQEIERGAVELETFSRLLAQAREEALTPADLEMLREEFAGRMAIATEELSGLERRSAAVGRVIAESRSSIIFLQGAYGFSEPASGRMLRHVVDENGEPVTLPDGLPLLSLEGKGPVAERQFIGTAFSVGDSGLLVTSRHVGQPWDTDVDVEPLMARGLEPVLLKFIGYLPEVEEPRNVALISASKDADVAILRFESDEPQVKGLRLADTPLKPGDEVIVMGYPTGMRIMLAQAGERFIESLRDKNEIDFWSVAAQLAGAGHITPLATRGIVGRTSEEMIAYDAETTRGGSGGPVLDLNGTVVAVNTAILPGYSGSSLGVPVAKVHQLLRESGLLN